MASHHSGLVVRGLPAFNADLLQVHLTRYADDRSRRRKGLTVHQQVAGAEADDGVIAPALAAVQAGCVNSAMATLVAADAGLRTGLAPPTS